MVKVERGNITLTRGDTAYFRVSVDNYQYATGDTLTMTIKNAVSDTNAVKTFTVAANSVINILPSDTVALDAKTYVYDVRLSIAATSELFTVIDTHNFTLVKGVANNE